MMDNERMNEWISEWMNEWMNEWINKKMNKDLIYDWKNDEGMIEWMNVSKLEMKRNE